MKTSLLKMIAAVAIPSMLAVGCGGDDDKKTTTTSKDMAMKTTTGGDMAVTTGCTAMTFPTDSMSVFANLGSNSDFDIIEEITSITAASSSGTYSDLDFGYYHPTGNPALSLPFNTTYSTSNADTNSLNTCLACLTAQTDTSDPADPYGPPADGKLYLAQSGTTSATKLDQTMPTGTVTVTGTNIQLVEWDPANDVAVTNGGCIEVASFNFTAMYDTSTPDGGGQ